MRRGAPRRWPSLAALIASALASVALVSGCGDTTGPDTSDTDPAEVLRVLPTPPGFTPAPPATRVEAPGFAAALREDPGLVDRSGLVRGGVRSWEGPAGARLLVAVGVWEGHQTATAVTGGAAEQPLREGGQAWTPKGTGSTRGARQLDATLEIRTLSRAVGETGVYIRADGPVEDSVVVRTMQLTATVLEGGEG